MSWTNQINRVAGVALLLLALGIILSIVFDVATTDADPFERDQVEEFLRDINSNEASAILLVVADLATDAAFGIAAAVGLYLIFRERNRLLALFGFALIFGGTVAFIAADAATVPLIFLAQDFVEKGGPGGIAAGDDVILEIARAIAIWSIVVELTALTAIGAGTLAFGTVIAWTPAGAGVNPPRWIGWLAVLAQRFSLRQDRHKAEQPRRAGRGRQAESPDLHCGVVYFRIIPGRKPCGRGLGGPPRRGGSSSP